MVQENAKVMNVLSEPEAEEIRRKLAEEQVIEEVYEPFGDGHAAEKIVGMMEKSG